MASASFFIHQPPKPKRPALPSFLADATQLDDSPELIDAWLGYRRDGNASDFQFLIFHYLRDAKILAANLLRRYPSKFPTPDEAASQAIAALIEIISCFDPARSQQGAAAFHAYFWRWGLKNCLRRVRRDNRNFFYHPSDFSLLPRVESANEEREDGSTPADEFRSRESQPDQRAQNAELKKLIADAARSLDHRDREILRLIINGATASRIASRFGLTRERGRQLVNRLLWTLRANEPLARYAGFEAEKPLCESRKGPWETPARRIAA